MTSILRRDVRKQHLTIDEIACSGKIVPPNKVNPTPEERWMLQLAKVASPFAGVHLHTVKHPDGIITLLPGDPANTADWQRRVTKVYYLAAAKAMGPIKFES